MNLQITIMNKQLTPLSTTIFPSFCSIHLHIITSSTIVAVFSATTHHWFKLTCTESTGASSFNIYEQLQRRKMHFITLVIKFGMYHASTEDLITRKSSRKFSFRSSHWSIRVTCSSLCLLLGQSCLSMMRWVASGNMRGWRTLHGFMSKNNRYKYYWPLLHHYSPPKRLFTSKTT